MDEIQRKLALIDEEIAGRNLLSRLAGTAPLFYPAVGLMTGILLQDSVLDPVMGDHRRIAVSIWLAALVIAAIVTWLVHRGRDLRPQTLAWVALLCFACLGAVRVLSFDTARPSDIRHMVGEDRILATIRGRLLTQPREMPQDWCFAQFAFTDPATAFYLSVNEIKTSDGWHRVCGTIRVYVDEPTPNLHVGDNVLMYCWLHRFEEPGNPGQFNVAEYLKRRNIYVGASVPAREAIEICETGGRNLLSKMRRTFAEAAARGLLDDASVDTPGEAILEALLLGERSHIDRETYQAFRRTGLLHFISLSGMHMGILIGTVWLLCRTAGLGKPRRAVVCMIATVVFLLVVPPRAPTVRAAVIVLAYCAAVLIRRRTDPLNSLSLAAIVLLLVRPTQLFEVGWQLSFAAVAGVLVLTTRIEFFIYEKTRRTTQQAGAAVRPLAHAVKSTDRRIMRLFSTGVAAWIGGAGILLYHFCIITPLASVWTVLLFPLITVILVMGFAKIVLFFILPTVSTLLGTCIPLVVSTLIVIVKVISHLDINCILIGRVGIGVVVLYYGLVLFVLYGGTCHILVRQRDIAWFASIEPRRRLRIAARGSSKPPSRDLVFRKGWLCAVWTLLLIACLVAVKWQRTHRDHLSMTCLDVGHGQAILVQLPGTINLLFDAGSLYSSDVGTRIVGPFLDRAGIGRLHAIVVSHHDIDHINGIPEIVDGRRVDRIYATEALLAEPATAETARVLVRHLRKKRVPLEKVPKLIESGSARIRVLWPTDEWANRPEIGDNDRSLVCLIEYAGKEILLCSDIERLAQQQVMDLYPTLKADVVVAPHHGSTATLDADFLEHLAPNALICSCGRRDYEQGRTVRPAVPGTLLVTARDGAVTVRIDRTGTVKTSAFRRR